MISYSLFYYLLAIPYNCEFCWHNQYGYVIIHRHKMNMRHVCIQWKNDQIQNAIREYILDIIKGILFYGLFHMFTNIVLYAMTKIISFQFIKQAKENLLFSPYKRMELIFQFFFLNESLSALISYNTIPYYESSIKLFPMSSFGGKCV